MRIFLNIFISILLIATFSFGQILNVDRQADGNKSQEKKVTALFKFGLDIDQEENQVIDFNSNMDITWLRNNQMIIFVSKFDITSNGSQKIMNAGFSHLRFRFNPQGRYAPELFMQYQWDGILGMKNRYLAGGNLRIALKQSSVFSVFLAGGLMFEKEIWDYRSVSEQSIPENPSDVDTSLVKINSYLKIATRLSKNTDLLFIGYYQAVPGKDFIHPRLAPTLQLNIALSRRIGFSAVFSGIYDYQPLVPIKKFHYSFSNNFTIKI